MKYYTTSKINAFGDCFMTMVMIANISWLSIYSVPNISLYVFVDVIYIYSTYFNKIINICITY